MSEQIQKLKIELQNELTVLCNLLTLTPTIMVATGRIDYLKELCDYQKEGGWIKSKGRMPYVSPQAKIIVKFRNGIKSSIGLGSLNYRWSDTGNFLDIIEYKIVG